MKYCESSRSVLATGGKGLSAVVKAVDQAGRRTARARSATRGGACAALRASPGFTLVEVLVVVAIIAVLAGVVVPVSLSMVAKGREAACLSNMRSIGVGLQGYLQDHNQMLPTLALGRSDKNSAEPVLETVLLPYVGSEDVFQCPADKEQFAKTGSSYNWNITQNGLHISKVAFFGIEDRPESVPLVSDKEAWHPGGTNFLYADSSASNKLRFATGNGKP
jgi:prepilin-type N-terminal cleavage/methylation domain-containing protein/prepilin-type processing-associated H-X9-DG protein